VGEWANQEYDMDLDGAPCQARVQVKLHGLKVVWKTVIRHLETGLEGEGKGVGQEGSRKHAEADLRQKLAQHRQLLNPGLAQPSAAGVRSDLDGEILDMIDDCAAQGGITEEDNIALQAEVFNRGPQYAALRTAFNRYVATSADLKRSVTSLKAILRNIRDHQQKAEL